MNLPCDIDPTYLPHTPSAYDHDLWDMLGTRCSERSIELFIQVIETLHKSGRDKQVY